MSDASSQRVMSGFVVGAPGGPSVKPESVDFISLQCQRVLGIPDWEWYSVRAVPPDVTLVEGAVCRVRYKTGSRKGANNWSKRDRSTDRTMALRSVDMARFRAEWERETGKCADCSGSAWKWCGASVGEGSRYMPCPRCKATGRIGQAADVEGET